MILDGYVRVSRVGDRGGERFISPSVQSEQIRAWVERGGHRLGRLFEELDESGGNPDRPLLTLALNRIAAGESDGIVVAKLDRFGRSILHGLSAIAEIEAAGATFVSVQDGLDLSTPTGRLMMRMMFALGEWELERVRQNWEVARQRAVGRGVFIAARAPRGYRRGKDGRLRREVAEAEIVAEAFRRRAEGQSARQVADFLNASELEPLKAESFTASSVHSMIKNRVYLGESRHGRFVNPEAHTAVIDPLTWRRAQFPPRRRIVPARHPLSGIVRCASCGRSMKATAPESVRSPTHVYRCYRGVRDEARCPGPAAARGDELEPLVEEFVFAMISTGRLRGSKAEVRRRRKAVRLAQHALAEYRDDIEAQMTLGPTSFHEGLRKRIGAVEEALLELARAQRAAARPEFDMRRLEDRWPRMSPAERQASVAELIDHIAVERGREPVAARAWVCLRGQGPITNDRTGPLRPFDPESVEGLRLPEPALWEPAQIEAELRRLLRGCDVWPGYAEFADAGLARLHRQVMQCGGPYWWGPKLGIQVPEGFVIWNEERVRGALRPLLADRDRFPGEGEFAALGLRSLRTAIEKNGGLRHWAAEFDLACRGGNGTWSKEMVEPELRDFIRGHYSFPTRIEFRDAGRMDLFHAVKRHGGVPYWSRRFDLRAANWNKHKNRRRETRARGQGAN